MDVKVSRKETRMQPAGSVEVLVDNIFDLYPIYASDPRYAGLDIQMNGLPVSPEDRKHIIVDVEIIDDDRQELLDRAMWALVKQRGTDPLEPSDGVEWAEAVIGEVASPAIMQQVQKSISEEGPGVRVMPYSVKGKLTFKVELTNTM